jgi:hypothetical protein
VRREHVKQGGIRVEDITRSPTNRKEVSPPIAGHLAKSKRRFLTLLPQSPYPVGTRRQVCVKTLNGSCRDFAVEISADNQCGSRCDIVLVPERDNPSWTQLTQLIHVTQSPSSDRVYIEEQLVHCLYGLHLQAISLARYFLNDDFDFALKLAAANACVHQCICLKL